MTQQQRDHLVGIDPSFTKLGVCIQHRARCDTQQHMTWTFLDFERWIRTDGVRNRIAVILEDPNEDSHHWTAWREFKKSALTKPETANIIKSEFKKALKIAADVGANKAAARQITLLLEENGVPFATVAPSKRDSAKGIGANEICRLKWPTKTTVEQYHIYTNIKPKGSSEHSRDAGTLITGRTVGWIIQQHKIRLERNKATATT